MKYGYSVYLHYTDGQKARNFGVFISKDAAIRAIKEFEDEQIKKAFEVADDEERSEDIDVSDEYTADIMNEDQRFLGNAFSIRKVLVNLEEC
jgi:hypothetical protein